MKVMKKQKGYIALITVLVIGTVLMSVLMTLPLITTDILRSTSASRKGIQSREIARSCSEIAIIQLQRNLSYEGESLNLDGGHCTIEVTPVEEGREIHISAFLDEYGKEAILEVEVMGRSATVTSLEIY